MHKTTVMKGSDNYVKVKIQNHLFFYLILNVLYGSYYKTRFSKCQYVFQNLF